jgi:hypothetical protein
VIDLDIIQEIENYLERPVLVKTPDYYEVTDPETDELLATVERTEFGYSLRINGEHKITISKT